MTALDIRTTEGASAFGDVAGARFIAYHANAPELHDARLAWCSTVSDALTSYEAFKAFARAFMARAAFELARERGHLLAEHADERAELERAVSDTLRASREGRVVGQQEAARQALRGAIRYGLAELAREAAERLCEVQVSLERVKIRPERGRELRAFEAFAGDA